MNPEHDVVELLATTLGRGKAMPSRYAFEVENLILVVRDVLEMDLEHPATQLAAMEMLACALDMIDDYDPPIDGEPDEEDDADLPYVRT